MGMDIVEIVMRTEEIFAIELPNEECASIVTVGDLFKLVLEQLHLPYRPADELEKECFGRDYSNPASLHLAQWNIADVWATIRGIITDQLQVKLGKVREASSFVGDLHLSGGLTQRYR
jgi:acyl carrier protein